MATETPRDRRRQRRIDLPRNHWHRPMRAYESGRERFRFTLLGRRGQRNRVAVLDRETTSASWTWETATLTGSLTMQPARGLAKLDEGEEVRCEVSRVRGAWREIWTMIARTLTRTASDGSYEFEMADRGSRFNESRADYRYRSKKDDHPQGWLCHQIAADAAAQSQVPIGVLAKGHYRIKKLSMKNASTLAVVAKAYAEERKHTGRRYVIDVHDGRLNVYPLRYSKRLLILAGELLDASVMRSLNQGLCTVLTARATVDKKDSDKDKGKRKLTVKVKSEPLIRRFGYIHRQVDLDAQTEDELREAAKRYLHDHAKPKRELTLTVPGVWNLRRGDAIQVRLPDEGLRRRILFVRNVVHTIAPGEYTMELTLYFTDPIEAAKQQRELLKKCEKAKEGKHKLPKDCPKQFREKPKRNRNREDHKPGKPGQKPGTKKPTAARR